MHKRPLSKCKARRSQCSTRMVRLASSFKLMAISAALAKLLADLFRRTVVSPMPPLGAQSLTCAPAIGKQFTAQGGIGGSVQDKLGK